MGPGDASSRAEEIAAEIGMRLGRAGAVVVCGGLTGVMEAVCRGAKEAGGTTLGILPTASRLDANPYVDVAIPTGMGEMRNALVVRAADVVIALEGAFGTLSEIALALKTGVPVVGIDTWELSREGRASNAILRVRDAEAAVENAMRLAEKGRAGR